MQYFPCRCCCCCSSCCTTKSKVTYLKNDIDVFNRNYALQYLQIPQRFEHLALMEGVLLRNMIEHLDYEEIIDDYSYMFQRPYIDMYRELHHNIIPMKTDAIFHMIGLSNYLYIFQQINFQKLMEEVNKEEETKAQKNSKPANNKIVKNHGEKYMNGSLVVQYIRDLGLEKRQKYGLNEFAFNKIVMIFSILFNDSVDAIIRSKLNYTLMDELKELRALSRIHTPGEQKRCSIFLAICSKILKDTDYKIERSLKYNMDDILEQCFSLSSLDEIKKIFTNSCLHSLIRLFYEIDQVRCGSISMFHILRCFQYNSHRDFGHSVLFTNTILKLNPNTNGKDVNLSEFLVLMIDICTMTPFQFLEKIFTCLNVQSLKDLKHILEMKNQLNFASPCDTLMANWCERVIYGGAAGIVGSTNTEHLYEVIDSFPLYFISIFYIQKRILVKTRVKLKIWQQLKKIRSTVPEQANNAVNGANEQHRKRNRKCHQQMMYHLKHFRVNRWLHSIFVKEKIENEKNAFQQVDNYKLYTSEKEYFAVVRGRDKGIFQSWADVEDKIYGLSDILYFQCSTMKTAEEKLGIWSRRKRKKIWRRLYDND